MVAGWWKLAAPGLLCNLVSTISITLNVFLFGAITLVTRSLKLWTLISTSSKSYIFWTPGHRILNHFLKHYVLNLHLHCWAARETVKFLRLYRFNCVLLLYRILSVALSIHLYFGKIQILVSYFMYLRFGQWFFASSFYISTVSYKSKDTKYSASVTKYWEQLSNQTISIQTIHWTVWSTLLPAF